MKFLIYLDRQRQWRWKLIDAVNGVQIGNSGQGHTLEHCLKMVESIKADAPIARILKLDAEGKETLISR